MKKIYVILVSVSLLFFACKKETPEVKDPVVVKTDTADIYTGIKLTYDQLGYKHFGRIASQSAIGRTYILECKDIQIVNNVPQVFCLHFWDGKPTATFGIFGKYPHDTFERSPDYNGCNKVFSATSPFYTYSYKISSQGTLFNFYTTPTLPFNTTYDLMVCDNNGTAQSKALYSIVKPCVLSRNEDYYAYHLVNEVVGKGFPLLVSTLNKSSGEWSTVDTVTYLQTTNTSLDAIITPGGNTLVCLNPMPTNSSIASVKVFKKNGSVWDMKESQKVFGAGDSIPALGSVKPNQLRWIENGETPYIALLNDNAKYPSTMIFEWNGTQVNLFTVALCQLEAGLLATNLHFVCYDNAILTVGVNKSFDYAMTIYKVTTASGFVPYKKIPLPINKAINRLHVHNGALYLAVKEIWSQDFFPTFDRHTEFLDLLKLK